MNPQHEPASSASEPLDREDREALDRVSGSANQGAAPGSPTAGGPQGSPAVTPQALVWAGHVVSLCNQFFITKFGAEAALPDRISIPIQSDLALAIDTYLPALDAKPGIFAAIALAGHFIACAQAASAKRSASSARAGAEKPPSSSSSSDSDRVS